MGYETYVIGGYKIEPSLPDSVIEQLDMHEDGESELICKSGGTPDTVGLVNGQIAVISGNSWTEVECRLEEPFKAYTLDETVGTLADVAKKQGATMIGALYLDGEESSDFSRYRIQNGTVIHEVPEFLWPNGDKGWG